MRSLNSPCPLQVRQRMLCHERTHTGDRPFMCPLMGCSRSYFSKTNMQQHVKDFHKRQLRDVLAEKSEMQEAEDEYAAELKP